MTEKKANEIFRTKYPEGEIVRRNNSSAGNKFWVTFKPEGKVYYYACSTYQELLTRFGFKIAYKHDIESVKGIIAGYEKKLEDAMNGKFSVFDFVFCERNEESEKQIIEYYKEQIANNQKQLDYYMNECIVD